MMKEEFERIAGYEVDRETYEKVIEPLYYAAPDAWTKERFVRSLNRKEFEKKPEPRKPHLLRMRVRNRLGDWSTPNGCWVYIEWVDLIDVDIRTKKYIVRPIDEETAKELYHSGRSLDTSGWYDVDYTDCLDEHKKPVVLTWD